MLVGFVSDERFVAIPDVLCEFISSDGISYETKSRARGSIYIDIPLGLYNLTFYKEGYGSKSVDCKISDQKIHQFRLLSNNLCGYVWPKWTQSDSFSEFRVHSTEPYKLELWKYGLEKQFIRNVGWFDEHGPGATMQITPDGDYTQTGVEWNKLGYRNNPNHLQNIQAPRESGLYYFHAKTDTGRFYSFPWIVAPKQPTNDIAVLASNINWNVYNNFGGRSNYIHTEKLPERPCVNARLDLARYNLTGFDNYHSESYNPLSFDRPEHINFIPEDTEIYDEIEGRTACHLAPAEWRLFGWLERENFSYDLYAETQFHSGILNLNDYKILIISTHPEYWTKQMYYSLKNWVFEGGGKLLYLGGNGLNCEIEFLDDFTISVKNGSSGSRGLRKMGIASRFAASNESEANLLGVVFTETGIMTGAPYRVINSSHWVFADTNLQDGDSFGHKSLHMRCHGGASGHETDKISPESPKNLQHLAKGLNPDDGGADMIYYETSSGGEVFSTGSITYTSSLIVDKNISTITSNVIKKFLNYK